MNEYFRISNLECTLVTLNGCPTLGRSAITRLVSKVVMFRAYNRLRIPYVSSPVSSWSSYFAHSQICLCIFACIMHSCTTTSLVLYLMALLSMPSTVFALPDALARYSVTSSLSVIILSRQVFFVMWCNHTAYICDHSAHTCICQH